MTSTPTSVLIIDADTKRAEQRAEALRRGLALAVDLSDSALRSIDLVTRAQHSLALLSSSTCESTEDLLNSIEDLKRNSPSTSVIVISDDPRIEVAVSAIRRGAEDYLKEPSDIETISHSVRRALDQRLLYENHTDVNDLLYLIQSCQAISSAFDQVRIFSTIRSALARTLGAGLSSMYEVREKKLTKVEDDSPRTVESRAIDQILDLAVLNLNDEFPETIGKMIADGEYYKIIAKTKQLPALFIFHFTFTEDRHFICLCLFPDVRQNIRIIEQHLQLLRNQIEVAGKNIERYVGVENLAYRDELSGLPNLRSLNAVLEMQIRNATVETKPFAVLFIDIDHFKELNDSHGHAAGDAVIKELAVQLKKYIRESDSLFRYAGDEFVAVLFPCDRSTSNTVAERIRSAIASHSFMGIADHPLHLTVSIGIALFPEHGDAQDRLLKTADQALYAAKKQARNRVVLAAQRPVVLKS